MVDIKKQEEQLRQIVAGDRDQVLKEHILKDKLSKDVNHANSHLGSPITKDNSAKFKELKVEWLDTTKYRVAMVIAPSWGVLFPPYNVAKLTALLRKEGYSVKAYDTNVECYHHLIETTGEDYWRSERFFYWVFENNFKNQLLDKIKPILDKTVNDILESNVKVVGFSVYNTNFHATLYMIKKIKESNKDVCIIGGGPEPITGEYHFTKGLGKGYFNYIFIGESEENLITLLDNLPEEYPMNEVIGSIKSRLALEKYPYPDYTDYDLTNYLDNGISMETSRGCVAKCSFCAETYFWDFRSLSPQRIVDEIEYQVTKHKIRRVWFVDSLINGNIKNFRQVIDLIIERKLEISWNSYARCDGRIDREFFDRIKESGGTSLSFGVETGSQKVLDDMRKKVQVWEIENNLRDCHEAAIFTHVNWMIGFATEEPIDHFHSMQTLYNTRKYIDAISPGMTAGLAANSHSVTNYQDYEIIGDKWGPSFKYFLNQWSTKGQKNTVIHRFLRLKMFHIWLQIMEDYKGSIIHNSQKYDLSEHYKFTFEENPEIENQGQDHKVNFLQFGTDLKGTVANEYIAFCYLLARYFKGVHFKLEFNPSKDLALFGDSLARNYTAKVIFNINKNGNYILSIIHKLDKHFEEEISKNGHITDWQTDQEVIRETIHKQYRKKND